MTETVTITLEKYEELLEYKNKYKSKKEQYDKLQELYLEVTNK